MIRTVLAAGVNVGEVFVDTVGDPAKYERKLVQLFPSIRNIIVTSKADSIYPIVSAASILAKVTRDRSIRNIQESVTEGAVVAARVGSVDMGSGYPSDEKCKEWMRAVIEPVFLFPRIVRFSWETVNQISRESRAVEFEWGTESTAGGDLRIMMAKQESKLFLNRNLKLKKLIRK